MSNAFSRPLAQFRLRLALRSEMMRSGRVKSWSEANAVLSELNTDAINQAMEMVQANPSAYGIRLQQFNAGIRKLGDGSIIQAILDFLQSPLGQALIQALMALLLGMFNTTDASTESTPQAMTAEVEDVMTSILGQPAASLPHSLVLPAGVDWAKIKEGLQRWLPMLKLIAATTANKYDDAVVAFLESLLASVQ